MYIYIYNKIRNTHHTYLYFFLFTDPTILHIVQEYLGTAPMNTQVNTWWSVAGLPNYEQSQLWHQDFTWIKFIKRSNI